MQLQRQIIAGQDSNESIGSVNVQKPLIRNRAGSNMAVDRAVSMHTPSPMQNKLGLLSKKKKDNTGVMASQDGLNLAPRTRFKMDTGRKDEVESILSHFS